MPAEPRERFGGTPTTAQLRGNGASGPEPRDPHGAIIFNIQRFAVHDGPGIRTTVFVKGCPLRCVWCHNPEGMEAQPTSIYGPEICIHCGRCMEGFSAGAPEAESPTGARETECPTGARATVGEWWSIEGLMEEIRKDRVFFEESGGGVTFSGGEPLSPENAPFVQECLSRCARDGIHRIIDTSGYVDQKTLLSASRQCDLVLYDLKPMNAEVHRQFTGVDNGRILQNLRALSESGAEIWIRIPLIPGITDTEENLNAAGIFLASMRRRHPVHLLPFHRLARDKHHRMGLEYKLSDLREPGQEDLARAAAVLQGRGLEVRIGG